MKNPRFPSLFQINTRVWLNDLSKALGRPATLDDIPDFELDRLAQWGFDWVWFLSVWQTGLAGRRVSRDHPAWRKEFQDTLPDLEERDIGGSGFAITGYTVHEDLGGDEALARLRDRLKVRDLHLMLDFVPNHTALDHPWVTEHPDYYVSGTASDLSGAPQNYIGISRKEDERIFAHGRDPYFDGWPDTLQLNYGNPALQEAMIQVLLKIAGQCDGVRCDMAMLVLPEVFERTWGIAVQPFWPVAIHRVRERVPEFWFMAEVYWDLEWTLQQQGFDYTYDKRLYDRLREAHARQVREHLQAEPNYQNKMARFLENHDEPRATAAFPREVYEAAAVITFLTPGVRFFHQGQVEGRKKRISPHLVRAPREEVDPNLPRFYERLFAVLARSAVREGRWQMLECLPAWEGNWTCDCFLSFFWQGAGEERLLVAVNYAANQSQCYVRLPFPELGSRSVRLEDLIMPVVYDRDGSGLVSQGLYLDMPGWGYHVFEVRIA